MAITGDEVSIGMKIFGRSAGEFLTNCVGAVLAGVNIVMSAIDLAKTADPLQKDMDIMMIISSGLQLLAIAANWLVTAAVVTDGLAVSILSSAAAVAGPLAIAFAIAGLVIMIVMACTQKTPPNPVQDFVDQHAFQAGLKMDHGTAIDYFNVVPPDATATSLNGISFEQAASGNSKSSFIQLGTQPNPSVVDYSVNAGDSVTFLPDTCWNVQTDSTGITTIWTYYIDPVSGQKPLCLTDGGDGTVHALPPPAKVTTDANGNSVLVDVATYLKELLMQQWTFTTLSDPVTTQRTYGGNSVTYATSCNFALQRGNNYLAASVQNGSTVLTLNSTSASAWTLSLQSMSPSAFNYIQPDWQLSTNQTDERNAVSFTGPSSGPLSWSITPALPSFLTLDSTDGTISQATGVLPTAMPATIYTVTASITILAKVYPKTVTVTITVSAPPDGTPSTASLLQSLADHPTTTSGFSSQNRSGLRSRFTSAKENIAISAPNEQTNGMSRAAADLLPQVGDIDWDQIQADYDSFVKTAPVYFLWQQPQSVVLNQHYTASAAIVRMQNSLSGSWDKFTNVFSSNNVAYEDIYFPSRPAAPPNGNNDPIDYHGAAQAFTVQSIYNGDGYAQVRSCVQCC